MNKGKNSKVYAIGIDRRVRMFWITLAILIALFSTYAIFLNLTIANIVFVEETSKKIDSEKVKLAYLEEKYLIESQKISLENALALELVEDKNPSYIKVTEINGMVTLNTESR